MLTAKHKLDFNPVSEPQRRSSKLERSLNRSCRAACTYHHQMMALAIRLDHLIKSDQVTDQAELARVDMSVELDLRKSWI